MPTWPWCGAWTSVSRSGARPSIGRSPCDAPAGGRDLPLDTLHAGKVAARPPVPVARVVEVALQGVHDAVQPGGQVRLLPLHDLVRGLPLTLLEKLHRLQQWPPRLPWFPWADHTFTDRCRGNLGRA